MGRLKVALLSSGSGSRGGGEIYLSFLAEGLATLGHEVHALVPGSRRMDELAANLSSHAVVARLDVRATYERRFRSIGAVLDRQQQNAVTRRIAELAPDIIHVN